EVAPPPRSRSRSRSRSRWLTLHECLEPAERLVPLARDRFEGLPRLLELVGAQLPDAFAPPAAAVDQAGAGEHLQVLGDRLAGDRGAGGEAGNRGGPSRAEAGDAAEAPLGSPTGAD